MKISMKLLSDTIFGNGVSVPGAEDISVLTDDMGFPYYKGSTFKGVFREELEKILRWSCKYDQAGNGGTETDLIEVKLKKLLGASGDDSFDSGKLIFSDFTLPDIVKKAILYEVLNGGDCTTSVQTAQTVLQALTHIRTFTALDKEGIVKKGSLRNARCINKGLTFESEIICDDEELVKEVIGQIRWIGTMRNRGFGRVLISVKGDR